MAYEDSGEASWKEMMLHHNSAETQTNIKNIF